MSRRTLGIDEAGRGPALGPLVIAVVIVDTSAARALTRAGVADSKQFGAGDKAQARRRELAAIVRDRAQWWAVREVSAADVDAAVARRELNVLERTVARELIATAPACDKMIADGALVFGPLRAHYPNLVAVNHGESAHVAVAAASILAKDCRDQAWAAICARYSAFGPIAGGGYVNAATARFVRAYVEAHGDLPPEARRSWPHPYVADLLPIVTAARASAQLSLL